LQVRSNKILITYFYEFVLFRIDTFNKICVFDNCSRLRVEDCLQHDFEGILNIMIKDYLGCGVVWRSEDGVNVCRFWNDGYVSRPENKSAAIQDGVIGGIITSSVGAIGTTQIGIGDIIFCF
jgi:hypothetical protein